MKVSVLVIFSAFDKMVDADIIGCCHAALCPEFLVTIPLTAFFLTLKVYISSQISFSFTHSSHVITLLQHSKSFTFYPL